MAVREFTYRVVPPGGQTIDQVMDRMVPAARNMLRNKWVAGIHFDLMDDHILLMFSLSGHDQWWIKRRVLPLVTALLTQSSLTVGDAVLTGVRIPDNLKHARFWVNGRSGQKLFLPVDGSEPKPKPTGECKNCDHRKPAHLYENRSGWHHTYQGTGH